MCTRKTRRVQTPLFSLTLLVMVVVGQLSEQLHAQGAAREVLGVLVFALVKGKQLLWDAFPLQTSCPKSHLDLHVGTRETEGGGVGGRGGRWTRREMGGGVLGGDEDGGLNTPA